MARKRREWRPHTAYHVTCRGNRRSDIFIDREDFQRYLDLLEEALNQFRRHTPYDLICYCLMDNHVHLLIHTSTNPLGPFIKHVNMKYAIYFNKKNNYSGHLFQDRFYSDPVVGSQEILTTSRYIHLNPVAANMVERPSHYPHSSYRFLTGLGNCHLVNDQRILSLYQEKEEAYALYKKFVESKLDPRKA